MMKEHVKCMMCYLPKTTEPLDPSLPVPVCYACKRQIQAVVAWLEHMDVEVTPLPPNVSAEGELIGRTNSKVPKKA